MTSSISILPAPLLLIAGVKDDSLPFSQAAYVADNGPKEYISLKVQPIWICTIKNHSSRKLL
ncbi:MAG: hypothetical protein HDS16_05760 [Bacteroides sp.]|nr:hypothetical protein [Bacteroides sp.]